MMISAWLLACTAAPVSSPPPDAPPPGFSGVRSVRWDGADGLSVSFDQAHGPVDTYLVHVQDSAGTEVASVQAHGSPVAISELAEGVYTVRVEALRPPYAVGGERHLEQLVGADRLVLLSHVPGVGMADVWGQGDTLVTAGFRTGHSAQLFDISDPTRPVELPSVDHGGFVKDVKIGDGLLFTQSECCALDEPHDGVGARIWRFDPPQAPELLSEIGAPLRRCHNLAYGEGFLYATDNDSDGLRVYDVTQPTAPALVGGWLPPGGHVHDQTYVNGKLYVAWWQGWSVLDVSDPSAPVLLSELYDPEVGSLHNLWPTQDERYVLTTSEIPGGHLNIYDLIDPANPTWVAEVDPFPGQIIHNVTVQGRYAYVSWYREGLVVIDLLDPTRPQVVGQFNTFSSPLPDTADTGLIPPEDRLYAGAWGVWPFGDHVAVTDKDRGLFLLDFYPHTVSR